MYWKLVIDSFRYQNHASARDIGDLKGWFLESPIKHISTFLTGYGTYIKEIYLALILDTSYFCFMGYGLDKECFGIYHGGSEKNFLLVLLVSFFLRGIDTTLSLY